MKELAKFHDLYTKSANNGLDIEEAGKDRARDGEYTYLSRVHIRNMDGHSLTGSNLLYLEHCKY